MTDLLKIILYTFLFCSLFSACNQRETKEKLIFYDDGDCEMEKQRAKFDLQKGLIVYSVYGAFDRKYAYTQEIEELLSAKGIKYENLGENCFGSKNCYGQFMKEKIDSQFGENFIDSILLAAKTISDGKWETKIYDYQTVDNVPIFSSGMNSTENAESYLSRNISLPKSWKANKEAKNKNQEVFAELIIDKKGKAKLCNACFELICNEENQALKTEIENELINVIDRMPNFKPAEVNGKRVKYSEQVVIILD